METGTKELNIVNIVFSNWGRDIPCESPKCKRIKTLYTHGFPD